MNTQSTYQQPVIIVAFHLVRLYASTKKSLWQNMNLMLLPFANFTLPKKVDIISAVC